MQQKPKNFTQALCAVIALLQLSGCIPTAPLFAKENGAQTAISITSNNDYMQDCTNGHPVVYDKQMDYKGILPGVTRLDQLTEQFGQPNKSGTYNNSLEYLYFHNQYIDHFYITNNLVSSISVQADSETWFPLKSILEKYGCPDLILTITTDHDDPESPLVYDHTRFEYVTSGLSVVFDEFPVNYSNSPIVMWYGAPIPVNDYLENISYFLDRKLSKVVNFSEAVKNTH